MTEALILETIRQGMAESQTTGRYENLLLIIIFLSSVALLIWVVKQSSKREDYTLKQAIEREKLLTARVERLEDFIHDKFMEAIAESTKALLNNSVITAESVNTIVKMNESLYTTRTCFMTGESQNQIVEVIAEKVVKEVQNKLQTNLQ